MKIHVTRTAFTLALLTAAAAAQASAGPFSIAIGATPCADAMKKIGATALDGDAKAGVGIAESNAVDHLYPGAKTALIFCDAGKVEMAGFGVNKSFGNPAGQELYKNLSAKYKRIGGGPIPNVGNGYALFDAGDAIVELDSPHLSFEVSVTYYSKKVWAARQTRQQERAAKQARAKKDAL
ncbi:MAG: hypothetical protein IT501_05000 [Rubrivivax sp.]|nr:hypothetical protein [Rubrivivax sp.]